MVEQMRNKLTWQFTQYDDIQNNSMGFKAMAYFLNIFDKKTGNLAPLHYNIFESSAGDTS